MAFICIHPLILPISVSLFGSTVPYARIYDAGFQFGGKELGLVGQITLVVQQDAMAKCESY